MRDNGSFQDASTNGRATLATSRRNFIAGWKLCAGVALGLCLRGRSSLAQNAVTTTTSPTAVPRHSCFLAGTRIRTTEGDINIEELRIGRVATLAEIAECEGLGERHVRLLAPLAFVAPWVIAAIADGSVAGYATVTGLAHRLPDSWAEQERRHKV